ncbi:nickel/cobalt transporter [Orrella sp. JC864]
MLLVLPGLALAQSSHPFGVPETTTAGTGGWLSGFYAQMSAWQAHFYRQLTGALRAWQQDPSAGWLLAGLSFAYGVFHALGPGHGKAVISSYVLANRQTVRNGALLALASAMVQALTAIVLVTVAGLILNVTGAVMNRATWWLETGSYLLVLLLGLWLTWRRALLPLLRALGRRRLHAGRNEAALAWTQAGHRHDGGGMHHGHHHHHDHGHHHDHQYGHHHHGHSHGHDEHCGCGHAHIPDPSQIAGRLDWRRAWTAVLSVGLRPCTGAIIVLVFALSQQFYWAGIASALAMGLGTGLTVAALAGATLVAGNLTVRLGGRQSAWAARLRVGIEAGAALLVLALGLLLLGGKLAA